MTTTTTTPVRGVDVGRTDAPPVGTTMPEILRLGSKDGLTKANLGVDFRDGEGPPGDEGEHHDFDLEEIEHDLVVPKYAEIRPDGAVRLTAYVGAAHTPHSAHSRTEFRELGPDGKAKAKWSSKKGRHYVWCRGAVIKLPNGR